MPAPLKHGVGGQPYHFEESPQSEKTLDGLDVAGAHIQQSADPWSKDVYDSPQSSIRRYVMSAGLGVAEAKQKPSPWTKNMLKLYLCIGVSALYQCLNGYRSASFGPIKGNKRYLDMFDISPDRVTPMTHYFRASGNIGGCIGLFVAAPLCDLLGRRWALFIGSFAFIVTQIVLATAETIPQLAIGDMLNAIAGSIVNIANWVYAVEMAHPSFRGPMIGALNCFYFVGSAPGMFVPYATSKIDNDLSWRIPQWVALFFPLIALCTCLLVPESPRWLIANNRDKEALDIMAKYHGDGDPRAPIIQLQLDEMKADISVAGSDKRWWDYRDLFNTREARYRTWQAFATGLIGQWTGGELMSWYYGQMLTGVGITNDYTKLVMAGAQTPILFVVAIAGALLSDKIGRRRAFYIGAILFAIIFAILTALAGTNIATDNEGISTAKIPSQTIAFLAMIYLFQVIFSFAYTPLQVMYPLECLRFSVRAKGLALTSALRTPFGLYTSLVTPIAFANIGWRYYFWPTFWNLLVAAFVYRYCVETSNRTLEELTEIFRSKYPVKTSLSKSEIVIRGDEIIVHEVERLVD